MQLSAKVSVLLVLFLTHLLGKMRCQIYHEDSKAKLTTFFFLPPYKLHEESDFHLGDRTSWGSSASTAGGAWVQFPVGELRSLMLPLPKNLGDRLSEPQSVDHSTA